MRRSFILSSIDTDKGFLMLSLRFPKLDPWKKADLPVVGQRVEVTVTSCDSMNYYCLSPNDVEVVLPRYETSWVENVNPTDRGLIGKQLTLVIIEKKNKERILKGSIRQKEEDPWPQIHKRLPKGTQIRGTVVEVTPHFVRVNINDGFEGILPDSSLKKAGFELADFAQTVVAGQGLDVVVTKVFLAKRRIRLDLLRNIENQ
jgi:small subunit ribosomal protein S1